MSKGSEKRSTTFPLPSSPHCAPRMMTLLMANPSILPHVIIWPFMQLSEVYLKLGEDGFGKLIRSISIGKLKTFQVYDGFKASARLVKVNTESLRKATPRFWARISE